jgi:hypothetical protein
VAAAVKGATFFFNSLSIIYFSTLAISWFTPVNPTANDSTRGSYGATNTGEGSRCFVLFYFFISKDIVEL